MPGDASQEVRAPILPSTKVAALLDQYPEIEELLIAMAPPFQKLRNPVLRKTVARVASLEQAAAVARMPVRELVNRLRAAAGQQDLPSEETCGGATSYFSPRPEWFDPAKIVASIEEKSGDPGKMPVVSVLQGLVAMNPGEILELITNFLPAPGIDLLRKKGLRVWTMEDDCKLFRTYVSKPERS
jgi:TusA-related sulfurtransferase